MVWTDMSYKLHVRTTTTTSRFHSRVAFSRVASAWKHERSMPWLVLTAQEPPDGGGSDESIACALAEALHHSSRTKPSTCDTRATNDALRGQNTVTRAREGEVREEHHALRGQTRPLPVTRQALVQEPRPQEGFQRHTGVGFELVLDPVVSQMAEQLLEVVAPAPAVFQASSPAVEFFAPAPVVQAPTPVVEYIATAPSVFHVSTLVVEHIAPAPAVLQAPAPVVENIAPVQAVLRAPTPVVEKIAPAPVVQAPMPVVENIVPAPAVIPSPAPVVEHFSPAPVVSSAHRGHEEAVPRVALLLRMGMDGRRFRVSARRSRPLWSTFDAFCTRLGLQVSQVRFLFNKLSGLSISPSDTPDQVGLVDGDLLVAQEVFEEDEEEDDYDDYDEIDGTESRFPAGFRPMRMCRWFPSGNCQQGWVCMFAHSVSELHSQAPGHGP